MSYRIIFKRYKRQIEQHMKIDSVFLLQIKFQLKIHFLKGNQVLMLNRKLSLLESLHVTLTTLQRKFETSYENDRMHFTDLL